MDLLEIDDAPLYFEQPTSTTVQGLLLTAATTYGEDVAEHSLLRAYFLAPEHLTVLVAIYRFYFYQHRWEEANLVAGRALSVSGARLGFPEQWRQLTAQHLGFGVMRSMGLTRFYLFALKAAAFLTLRRGDPLEAIAMLEKLIELDPQDRIGAQALLAIARESCNPEDDAEPLIATA